MPHQTIGRENALAHISRALKSTTTLIVHGVPGIGKTHLAYRRATERRDRAHFTELTAPEDQALALSTLALSLGLDLVDASRAVQLEQLRAALTERHIEELIIDTERLHRSTLELVTALQAPLPELKLIITTRALPEHLDDSIATFELGPLTRDESAELYARAANIDGANDNDVMALLDKLEGHPLSIELAAELSSVLSPIQIARRLDHELDAWDGMSGALTFAIEQCWEALDDAHQELMCQLSWFTGPLDVELVERCCGWDHGPIWRGLRALLDNGMLGSASPRRGSPRQRMLASVRLFVRTRADASLRERALDKLGQKLEHHAFHMREALMEFHGADLRDRLIEELPLIVEFVSNTHHTQRGHAGACVLLGFAVMSRRADAALFSRQSQALLADRELRERQPATYAMLSLQRAILDRPRLNTEQAIARFQRTIDFTDKHDLHSEQSQATRALAHCLTAAFQDADAERAHVRALALAKRANAPLAIMNAARSLGWFYGHTRRPERARAALTEALARCQDAGDQLRASSVHLHLARLSGQQGFIDEAQAHLQAVEATLERNPSALPLYLETQNLLSLRQGDEERALEQLEHVIAAHTRFENPRAVIGWSSLLASIHARHQRWEQATAILLEVLQLTERMNDIATTSKTLTLLAASTLAAGREDAARGYSARASALDHHRSGPLALFAAFITAQLDSTPLTAHLDRDAMIEAHGLIASALFEDAPDIDALDAWLLEHPESHWGRWSAGLASLLRERPERPTSPSLDVERALLFLPGEEAPIDLSRRAPQLNILAKLIALYEDDPANSLSIWDAHEIGWPDQQIDVERMEHRVRVVISRLRKLGLSDHIQTLPQAYKWRPGGKNSLE